MRFERANMCLILVLSCLVGLGIAVYGDDSRVGCLTCHAGIESIGVDHELLTCSMCHRGQEDAVAKREAHRW